MGPILDLGSLSSIDLNDPVPLSLSIDPSDSMEVSLLGPDAVAEGTAATYTVSVSSGGIPQSPVTADILVEGAGTGDLSGVPMSVVIPTGSSAATFRVSAVADGINEGDETFTVSIADFTGGGGGELRQLVSRKETTIFETAGPARVTASFGRRFLTVVEGSVASLTVSLSAAPGRVLDIPVVWRHEGGAGPLDHGEIAGTVRVGASATVGVLTLSAVADTKDETGERVRLRFGVLPAGVVAGDPEQAVVLIMDGPPRGIVRLSANRASVREGFDGSITVTAAVDGTPPTSDLRVTLSEESAGGEHTLGPGTLPVVTVRSRQSRGTATLRLVVPQDGVVEPVRTVVVTAAASGHAVEPLSVTVIDDDRAFLDITTHEDSDREIRLEVTLEGQVDGTVSVPWSAVGAGIDGNDVEPLEGTLVFEPNAGAPPLFGRVRRALVSATVTVLDDQLSEGDERVRFRMEDPTVSPGGDEMADRIGLRRRQSASRLLPDSPDPLSVTHTGGGGMTTVAEGATVTYTVALQGDNRPTAPVTVDLSASLVSRGGHDAAEAADFSLPSSVVIPVNATSAPVPVTVIDDMVVEPTETFVVSIAGARGGGGDGFGASPDFGDGWTVTVTGSSDTVTVSFTEDRIRFWQRGEVRMMTASVSAPSETPLTVRLTTNLTGSDLGFSGVPASLVFGPNTTLQSFGVTVDRDPTDLGNILAVFSPSSSLASPVAVAGFVDPQAGVVVDTPSSVTLVALEPPVFLDGERMAIPDGGALTLSASELQPVGYASALVAGHPSGGRLFGGDPDFHPYFWDGATAATVLGPFEFREHHSRSRRSRVAAREALDHETAPQQFVSSLAIFSRPPEEIPQAELAASVIASVPLTISVVDINENPSFDSPTAAGSTLTFTVAEDTVPPVSIGTMPAATDPEGDSFRYFFWGDAVQGGIYHERTGIVSDVMGPLALDGQMLRVDQPLDHETDSEFTVTVGISDFLDFWGNVSSNPNRFLTGYIDPNLLDQFFDRVTVIVTVTDVNEPPEFDGLPESGALSWSVDENSGAGTAVGDPVSVTDPEGDILTYSLEEDDDPSTPPTAALFGIDNAGQVTVAAGAVLDHEAVASHTVVIAISDDKDAAGGADPAVDTRATAVIAVADVNDAPTFEDQPLSRTVLESAEAGATVGPPVPATDPEGDTLSYSLEEDGDPGTPPTADLFGIDATGQITVSSGAMLDSAASPHTVIVAVSDGKDAAFGADPAIDARVFVTVTVLNEPPEFDGLSAGETLSLTVDENSGPGTAVGGPVSATDPEEDTLSYSLGEDDDPETPPATSLFGIDGAGQVTVSSGATLDHESVMSHTVVVSVSDGQGEAGAPDSSADISATVVIEVTDVNEAPTFGDPPLSRMVRESAEANATVGSPVAATDPDGDTLSYVLEEDGDPGTPPTADLFGINVRTGQITVSSGAALDSAEDPYTVVVAVSDGRDRAGDPDSAVDVRVSVTITVLNESPRFDSLSGSGTLFLSVDEDSPPGTEIGDPISVTDPEMDTLSYSLGEDDNPATVPATSLFGIDGAGQVTVSSGVVLDHESVASHTVVVSVSDGQDMAGTADSSADISVTVVIAVSDVNEAPTFAGLGAQPLSRTVLENAGAGTPVGSPVPATDPEGDALVYSLEEDDDPLTAPTANLFGIDATGQVTVAPGATLDHEDVASHTVVVAVSDGRNTDGQADSAVDTRATVVIAVGDVNEVPTFGDQPPLRTVLENVGAGTPVGSPVSATDPEGDALVYSLGEDGDSGTPPTAGLFGIDAGGQITVSSGAALDHESVASHTVVVSVSDGKDMVGANDPSADISMAVVIAVIDVNEAPTFAGLGSQPLSRTVLEGVGAGATVGPPVPAVDQDGDTLTYSLEEADNPGTPPTSGLFGIDGAGQITVAAGAELDHGTAASHTVVVAVSDGRDAAGGADPGVDARATVTVTVTDVNLAPTFDGLSAGETLSLSVDENSPGGTGIGDPILVTDPETDPLTYLLGEDDDPVTPLTADLFGIDGVGQITVSSGAMLDHESEMSHTVVVLVSDGKDMVGTDDSSADISATVVIAVGNVDEMEPGSLTVAVPASGPGDSLSVGWQAPEDTGTTLSYVVEYRESGGTEWIHAVTVTETFATIENLRDETPYDVRVRALSGGNGGGDWAMETAVETRSGPDLHVLPPVPGAGDDIITGDDALLLFYFASFRDVLADPMNEDVLQIIAGSLARGAPFDVVQLRTDALALVDGGALDGDDANLYKGTEENPSPFDKDDALLMFYALRFGDILVHPDNGDVLMVVVTSLLPDADELDEAGMRAIIQAGIDLNEEE